MTSESYSAKTPCTRRYPGSHPFEDSAGDRLLFHGRKREVDSLFHLVLTERLVVVFAKSGMGKTSLLNAGLMPRLRDENHVPVRIRFADPEVNPLQTLYESMEEFAGTCKENFGYECSPGPKGNLWQYFQATEFWSDKDELLTPVLIFDQFEELFTLHSAPERKEFLGELADLVRRRVPQAILQSMSSAEALHINTSPPRVKVVLSLREEYLALLEEFSTEIPEILDKRFRLMALSRDEATDAIVAPGLVESDTIQAVALVFKPDTIKEMLDFLCRRLSRGEMKWGGVIGRMLLRLQRVLRIFGEKRKEVPTDEVEPFQLALLCQHIENVAKQRGERERRQRLREGKTASGQLHGMVTIVSEDLGGRKGMEAVLKNFYRDQLKTLSSFWIRRKVRKLCESCLIIDPGLRLSLAEEDIRRKTNLKPAILKTLVDGHLLRADPRVDTVYYELSHDTLVEPIRTLSRERKRRRNSVVTAVLAVLLLPLMIEWVQDYALKSKEEKAIQFHTKELLNARIRKDWDRARIEYQWLLPALMEHKAFDTALETYTKALEDSLDPSDVWPDAGTEFKNRGLYLLGFHADDLTSVFEISKGEKQLEEFEKASHGRWDESGTGENRQGTKLYSSLVATYVKWDQFQKAIEKYKKGLDRKCDPLELAGSIVKALLEKGELNRVQMVLAVTRADLRQSKPFQSRLALCYYDRGVELERDEKYEDAIAHLRLAIQIEPSYYFVYRDLASSSYYLEQYESAIENCLSYLKHDKRDYLILNFLGVIYHDHMFDYARAYQALKEAAVLAPGDSSILANLAESSLCAGHFQESAERAEQVLKYPGISVDYRLAMKFVISSSHFCLGEHDQGRAWLVGVVKDCISLQAGLNGVWSYNGTRNFLEHTVKIPANEKEELLAVLQVLEQDHASFAGTLVRLRLKHPDLF